MSVFCALVRAGLRSGGGFVSTGGMAMFFAMLVGSLFGIALAPVPQTIAAGLVLSFVFTLPVAVLPVLALSLVCATLYLSLTGAIAALLTHGARQPGILMVVLILPVQLPMLLLALMAGERALLDPAVLNPYVYLQGALLLFALPLLAGGAAWVLRFQLSR